MNRAFVDTSAILALRNPDDRDHPRATRDFESLRRGDVALFTTSYVVVETYALLGRRFGLDAVTAFRETLAPLLDVAWVDRELHEAGLDWLVQCKSRDLSLVDAVSFVYMRRERLERAFVFDRHFDDEGFSLH